jgi:hypothetical protein
MSRRLYLALGLLGAFAFTLRVSAQNQDSSKKRDKAGEPRPTGMPRDPRPPAAAIDENISRRLKERGIPASPPASDSEFLRRVTLDLTGRIPSYDQVLSFLRDRDPDKRANWVETLLAGKAYGQHFATIWHEQMVPDDGTKTTKGRDETFLTWLADQFNHNQAWNRIVSDLLTVEGNIRDHPEAAFLMANSLENDPQPNLVADSVSRLFWGVQLRCAECHDHPFASWTQEDFWSTAAFFSRLRRGYTDGKNPRGQTLTEAPPDEPISQKFWKSMAATDTKGPAIIVPRTVRESAGKIVKGRFLGSSGPAWSDEGPYRPRFAAWATSPENPYFARNAVNRLWAHLFGRGMVDPLDGLDRTSTGTYPAVLDLLTREFVASGYDLKDLIRVICASQAYQRTSRPTGGNEADTTLFSHMSVKVMRAEMLYDALSIVLFPSVGKLQKGSPFDESLNLLPGLSRSEFVRLFRSRGSLGEGSVVNLGIPQFLRLMNGGLTTSDSPGLRRLAALGTSPSQMVEAMYRAAFARPPDPEELRLVTEHLAEEPDPARGVAGVLWTLLNSAEFVLKDVRSKAGSSRLHPGRSQGDLHLGSRDPNR